MQPDIPQPIVVSPGSGKVLELIGVTHKLLSQQTGGGYYLFASEQPCRMEAWMTPGT
jgi:hypothetical protein